MRIAPLALAFGLVAGAAAAQNPSPLRLPAPSPAASVSRVVGVTKVTVEYSSPAVKGRTIWGDLVPFGEVWRTGANMSTDIEFSDAVNVGGKEIPAGRYALFTIPEKDEWTVILSKTPKQMGSANYKEAEDLVRLKAKPAAHEHTEWLTFELSQHDKKTLHVTVLWEKLSLSFPVVADPDVIAEKSLKEAIANAKEGDFAIFAQAARFRLDSNGNLEEALQWADKAVSIKATSANLLLKARIQAKAGKKADALATLEKCAEAARGEKNDNRLKDIERLKGEWSK